VGGLSKEDGVLIWGDSEFDIEGVVPDLLHVRKVIMVFVFVKFDNTPLDWVRDLKDTSPLLSLIAYVLIPALKILSDVSGSADDGIEYSSGIIFT
jgi:hypothetical protein